MSTVSHAKGFMKKNIFAIACGILGVTTVVAQYEPGWQDTVSDAQTSQTTGYTSSAPPPVYQGQLKDAGTPGNNADFITAEIQALADGLAAGSPGPTNTDTAKRIFDYVHNNITYLHYYGCKKGAALTLWERSGNDFDQAALLVALLRAAGFTASYQYGLQNVEFSQNVADWLRLDFAATNYSQMATHIAQLAGKRRYPNLIPNDQQISYTLLTTAEQTLIFPRLWVVLSIDSTDYYLDPAFKVSERIQGIDLGSAIGSSKTNLLTAASLNATYSDPDWVKQLNETNLNAKLTAYTTNLLGYLRTQTLNATPDDILGGWRTVSATLDTLPTTTTWETITNVYNTGCGPCPVLNWDAIPDLFISSLRVLAVGGTAGTLDQTFQFAGLQGNRLSLTFTNTSPKQSQLWLDDTLLATETGGTGTNVDFGFLVNHPVGTWNYGLNTLDDTRAIDHGITNAFQRTTNGYVILYGFEPNGDLLRARQDRLAEYKRANYADTSREVLTETLNVIGQNWLFQTALSDRLFGLQNSVQLEYAHRVGRMAQEASYYVDVGCQLTAFFSAALRDASQQQKEKDVFDITGYFNSAMEHGVLEQMQGGNGASTVKLIKVSNGISTNKIYRATASNWSTVASSLVNYGTNITALANRVSGGSILLLPSDGRITVNQWRGTGYSDRRDSSQERSMGMIISGNNFGGYNTTYGTVTPTPVVNSYASSLVNLNPSPVITPTLTGADPVNMVDGSFTLNTVDLSVGQADPQGFAFSRQYNSKQGDYNRANLGYGWTHNYRIYANDQSDVRAGLGQTTPYEMAAYVVATRAAMDVYASSGTAREWATLALIAQWGVDKLKSNAVSIVLGKDAVQFARQPDGSLTPSSGITMTLTNSGGKYVLSQRLGSTFYFDSSNRVTSIKDPPGRTNLFKYDSSGRLTNIVDASSRKLYIAYNNSNLISVVSDSTGRQISFGYVNNDLTDFVDLDTNQFSYVYDSLHRILATRDAYGRTVTTNIFDGLGRVVEQYSHGDPNKRWRLFYTDNYTIEEDPAGSRKYYFYDAHKRAIGVQDANGNLSQLVYDGQDHIVQSITPLSEIAYSEYDANHNLRRTIDRLGHTNIFNYDSLNRVTNTIDARGFPRYFEYNTAHQITKATDATGHYVQLTYTNGLLQSRTDDAGNSVSYGYDQYAQLNQTVISGVSTNYFTNHARGDVTAHRDGRGFATLYEFNNRRLPTRTIAPTNLVTQMAYDKNGYLLTVTDPRQNVTTYSNSATGKRLTVTLPAIPAGTGVLRYGYDLRDWLTTSANPLSQTNYTFYDAAGNVASQFNHLQQGAWFGFDENNRLRASTNGLLEATFYGYDARGLRTSLTDPAQDVIRYAFDFNGNQTAVTNRKNAAFTTIFDPNNRVATNSTPLTKKTISSYETRGLLAFLQEPTGDTNAFRYDVAGRLTNRTDKVGVLTHRYDANNNLTNLTERTWNSVTQNVHWSFDAYNRVATYRDANSNLLQYAYDENGNLKKLIYPGGKEVNYSYDSQNHLTNVTDWASRTTSLEYDLAGQLRIIRRPNKTVRTIDYDAAGRSTNIVERTDSGSVIVQFKLGWNAASRMDWEFTAPLPHDVTPTVPTMTYDADNRIETFDGNSVTHDDDGNMTYGPVTNASFATYSYDARNRLLGVGNVSYAYDPQGNRIAVTNGTNVTRFVVNPNAALSQVLMRIKGGVTNFYVYGAGLLYDVTVGTNGVETATNTYHFDYRGSTVALTDAGGIVRDRIEYSVYGLVTYRAGTNDTPFLFNGRYGVQTDSSGLLYMRARYYNPYLCRFINPDPIGLAGGMNWYAYAEGNPAGYIDPLGLQSWMSPGYGAIRNPVNIVPPDMIATTPDPSAYFVQGLAIGAVGAGVVVFAAPVAVSGLVAIGVPSATATATVTGTIGVAGAVGGGLTVYDAVNNASAGNWNNVAYDAGLLGGGALVGGLGGGRYIADNVSPSPSTVPPSWNPFTADRGYGFVRNPALPLTTDVWNWLGTGPTPSSGGASAVGIGLGAGSLFQSSTTPGSWLNPSASFGSGGQSSSTGK